MQIGDVLIFRGAPVQVHLIGNPSSDVVQAIIVRAMSGSLYLAFADELETP